MKMNSKKYSDNLTNFLFVNMCNNTVASVNFVLKLIEIIIILKSLFKKYV